MKKLFYSCAIMALMASCSSDDEMSTVGDKFTGEVKVTAEAYEFDGNTRTSLTNTGSAVSFAWDDDETIGVFPIAPTTNGQAKQVLNNGTNDGLSSSFDGAGWALLKGNTYAAYYPFVNLKTEDSYTDIPVSFDGQYQYQNNSLEHIGERYDYMYANATIPSNGKASFNFKHACAIVMLELTMPKGNWYRSAFHTERPCLINEGFMDASTGKIVSYSKSNDMYLSLGNISTEDNGTLTLYMAVAPTEEETGVISDTIIESNNIEYVVTFPSKKFEAGKVYKLTAKAETSSPSIGYNNGHEWVDLGLPSGLKWANMNVGATKPEGKGTYFAWGEVTGCEYISDTECIPAIMDGYPSTWKGSKNSKYVSGNSKTNFGSWTYYKWYYVSTYNKYDYSTKVTLAPEDDAAHVNWGGDWRMPTNAEQDELRNNCTWTWTSDYNGTGVAGRIVTGPNGNSIFLPAAGYRYDSSFDNVGSGGYYWSSRLSGSGHYYTDFLGFYDSYVYSNNSNRYCGFSVRAVCR